MSITNKRYHNNLRLISADSILEQNLKTTGFQPSLANQNLKSKSARNLSFKFRTLDLGSYKMFFALEKGQLIYKFI